MRPPLLPILPLLRLLLVAAVAAGPARADAPDPPGPHPAPAPFQVATAPLDESPSGSRSGSAATPLLEPRQPGAPRLYFFSPDWRPADLGELAVSLEEALAFAGVQLSFQGFTRYEDFRRQVSVDPPVFVIAPSWIGTADRSGIGGGFRVVARPLRHGRTTYRKALMARPSISSIDDLASGSVAATLHSMGSGASDVVLGAFHLDASSAKLVPVPKDVDALLALSFGQVDAALVTSAQYERLAESRPAEADRLRVLGFSPEIDLPPVFAAPGADPTLEASFARLLEGLPEAPGGAGVLAMLGFDGFVVGDPAEPAPRGALDGGDDGNDERDALPASAADGSDSGDGSAAP